MKKFKDNWPWFEVLLAYLRYQVIKPYIIMKPKPVCVDIGCGFYGRFLKSISDKIERGYGFDIRGNDEEYRNVRIINNSKFDGNIPLKDGVVDCVFMLAILEHLPMDSELLDEGIRVLKKGGIIILTTPTPISKPILEFLSYRLHIISEDSIREHKHYFDRYELEDKMLNNGCSVLYYKKFELGMNQMIIGLKKD